MKKILAILCIIAMCIFPMLGLSEDINTPEPTLIPIEITETLIPSATIEATATPAPTAVRNAVISWVDARNTIYVGETMTFQVDLQGYDGMDAYLTWQYKLNDQDWRDLDAHGLTLVYKVQESGTLNIRLRIETP